MQITDRYFLNVTTPTCHASTMVFYKDHPVFAWFGGIREGNPDSAIYVQYKDQVMCMGEHIPLAYWNPILFTIKDELFLAYKRGEFCDRWTTYILNITGIEQDTNILNKRVPQAIPAGLNFCTKTKPYIDSGGWIHCGSSVETREDWTSYEEIYTYYDGKFIFDDRSKPLTVEKQKYSYRDRFYQERTGVTSGIIQPSIWVDNKNCYHAFFRSSRGLGKIYHSHKESSSWGDGEWTDPKPTDFDNPNSGIDTVYTDNRLFLVHNPSKTNRCPLVVSELNDDFDIVDEIVVQSEIDLSDHTLTKELSYPYMIEENKELHLVYTYGRTKIEYIKINI